MAKKPTGLTKRNSIWHINKVIKGKRLYESTGTSDLEEAERYLAKRITEVREQLLYGVRISYTFIEAATKYLKEEDKKSIDRDAVSLKAVMPYIGELLLEQIHLGTLEKFISDRKAAGIKNGTINRDIAMKIIDTQRGNNDEYVFTFKGKPVQRINGHACRKARVRAEIPQCRVHDLRHTFGRRLRASKVSFETRQDLLGHKSSRITDHYCTAEIAELHDAVEKLSRVNLA